MIAKKKKLTFDHVKQTVNGVMHLHGVSTTVGQMALHVTPLSAHSRATACKHKRIV